LPDEWFPHIITFIFFLGAAIDFKPTPLAITSRPVAEDTKEKEKEKKIKP